MDQIIEKIKKLTALQNGAATEAEAANAAARIADLCRKHNLDIGSIELEREEKEASESEIHRDGNFQAHWTYLSQACQDMFEVDSYYSSVYRPVKTLTGIVIDQKRSTKMVFFGLKANVESAKISFEYFLQSVEAMLEGWASTHKSGRVEYRAFRIGCARRISDEAKKIVAASKSMIEAGNESAKCETLAISRISNQLIKNHRSKLKLATSSLSGVRGSAMSAYGAGYAAGSRVDIHGARSSRMLR